MLVCPVSEGHEELGRRPAEGRQRVFDANRDLGVDAAFDEPVPLQAAQRVGEHLLRRASEVVVEPAVALGSTREQVQQVDLPLRRKEIARRARPLDHLEVLARGPGTRTPDRPCAVLLTLYALQTLSGHGVSLPPGGSLSSWAVLGEIE